MVAASPAPATSPSSAPSAPVLPPRPPGLVSRLPGTPDTIATVRDFPQRYRRRLLADEEMEYIQVSVVVALVVFSALHEVTF